MTIIGVVSAMTIPTLVNRNEASQLKAAFLNANAIVKSIAGSINSLGYNIDDLDANEVSKSFRSSDLKTMQ